VGGGAVAAPEVAVADPGGPAAASPWRKATPPPVAGDAAVMGAESWPALDEARQKVAAEPAPAGKPAAGNAGGADLGSHAPPSPTQV
jgi:la-related protein 1